MIRLIGIDVDGTLLDSRGLMPAENAEAIHAAVAAGIHVVLVTGRSYPFLRPVVESLPPAVTLIVSSGAVERTMSGATLVRRLLDRRVALAVLASTGSFRDGAALIFDRDSSRQLIFERMDWEHRERKGYWAVDRSLIAQSIPLEAALTEDPIQVMFTGGDEAMHGLFDTLRRDAQGYAVSLTAYPKLDFSFIDVTSPLATKGQALAWRAAELGLTPDQVMAVGDNFNDLDMLEFAGVPVVMGNAVEQLKERGWRQTVHQDDAGLAAAIRQFALGNQ